MRLRVVLVSVIFLTFIPVGTQAAPSSKKSILPRPSGPYGIGRVSFDWVDATRTADTAEPAGKHAEILVYVWYPTKRSSKSVDGSLLPGAKAIDADPLVAKSLKSEIFGGNWPLVVSGGITSDAQENAPILERAQPFPLILYSPGAFMSSFQSTSFIEDLVSHGYIVASLEHPYETFAVAFPDGRVIAYSPKAIQAEFLPSPHANKSEFNTRLQDWSRHRADERAADLSFALTKLGDLNDGRPSSPLAGRMDLARVAVIGHSRGGWAAIIACRRDRRFSACVNLDGNAAGEGLEFPGTPEPTEPVLYIEVPPDLPADWIVLKELKLTANQWVQKWHDHAQEEFERFPAGGYFVELKDPELSHYTFTDEVLLRAARQKNKTAYDGAVRGLRLSEKVLRTFLGRELKYAKEPVLHDQPGITVKHFPDRRK